ncbi:MAG: lipoprotein [Burkholderiaceae bacterium]
MLQRKMSVAAGFKPASMVCAWAATAALLGACGQKGPLVAPAASAPPAVAAPAASTPASAP